MDTETKNIQLTGPAAEDMKGGAKKGSRRSRRQHAGGSTSAGTIDQLGASSAPGGSSADAAPKLEVSVPAGAPLDQAFAPPAAGGGTTKVVLTKKKKAKVVLGAPTVIRQPAKAERNKTRKIQRINISLSGLTKKMTRANKIKGEAKKMDIAEVKKVLVKSGLIKVGSKAPDAILRQMYEDYATLKNRAL